MTVRDGRGDVKQTTTGFRGPLMVQSLTSAKSKFLSLKYLLSRFKPPTFDGMSSERIVQRALEYRPDSLRTYFIGAVARASRLVKRYN